MLVGEAPVVTIAMAIAIVVVIARTVYATVVITIDNVVVLARIE